LPHYRHPQLERELLEDELELARRIQQSLLPNTFPSLPGFGLAAFCRSARRMSGDYYDVLPLSEEIVLLIVADVMGKGMPAALFAATLRTLVRTLSESISRPSELLASMNRLMFEELSKVDMFITVQVAVADFSRLQLTVASAGHCPFLVADRFGSVNAITPEGIPLGILSDAVFGEEIVPLNDMGGAMLYTDGLTETLNLEGELFGQERLERWLSKNARPGQNATLLQQRFISELNRFQCGSTPFDDQTFLLLVSESARCSSASPVLQ
jgi:serine phosphatase RsbU (regulator of sigma subunit)